MNINSVFWTFQGEGLHAGRRALFIRMPYCNLDCSWCDTSFDSFQKWDDRELEAVSVSEPSRFAVITGGEPLMNKHTPLVVDVLRRNGFTIACETNGNFKPNAHFDFITVSPKRFATTPYMVDPITFAAAHEFKYVVDRYFDFSILSRHDTNDGRRYSLSPEFDELPVNLNKIFNHIKENPTWRISLQTHKWMSIP